MVIYLGSHQVTVAHPWAWEGLYLSYRLARSICRQPLGERASLLAGKSFGVARNIVRETLVGKSRRLEPLATCS